MLINRLQRSVKRLHDRRESLLAQTTRVHDARLWTAALFFGGLVVSTIWRERGLAFPICLVAGIAFVWLFRLDLRLGRHLRDVKALAEFNARQLARLQGEPPPGVDSPAGLGADINLTGPHSLFSLLDETFSTAGRQRLMSWITRAPDLASIEAVRLRQKQIQELSAHVRFLRRLRLKAAASSELRIATVESERQLEIFAGLRAPFWHVILSLVVWAAWLCVVIPFVFGVPGMASWSAGLLLLFAGVHRWSVSQLSAQTESSIFKAGEGLNHHLDALSPLFAHIEAGTLVGAQAGKLTMQIRAHRPAHIARSLSRWLAAMSVEGNPLVYILLAIFTPWHIVTHFGFLRKAGRLHAVFHPCLEELTELEALSSLVFLYVYQTRTFADISSSSGLTFEGLYHPLLKRDRAIANTFEFNAGERLGLITGSNMAGKSTFLRTVGLNQVLALMGAPVFARSMSTGLYRVETCIQVTDSLRDGFSYFFAEVQRLSQLTRHARSGPACLYLIDEIFRGTNNHERRIGSRAVIEMLARTESFGFISTHDLELTEIAQAPQIAGRIRNLHFKDDIEEGEMVFHYKIHEGPCPSTNALTIMRQAGLGPLIEDGR